MRGIDSWIRSWAWTNPGGLAITFEERSLTWVEFEERVNSVAARLSACGIGQGDRVGCLMHNRIEYLELFFASARLRAIFVPLNVRYTSSELASAVTMTGMSLLGAADEFGELMEQSGIDTQVLWTSEWPRELGPERGTTATGEDPCTLLFTSGSTGRPRASIHTHESVLQSTLDSILVHHYRSDDRMLTSMPLCFSGGMITAVSALYPGAELVLSPNSNGTHMLRLIEKHRPTLYHGVPMMVEAMIRSPAWDTTDVSSMRLLRAGSAPVSPRLMEACMARGVVMTQGWGLSESNGGGLTLPARDTGRIGKVGRPAFSAEVRLVDIVTGEDVPDGTPGQILLRGPSIMKGYWNDPESTATMLRDGWLWTGDVAIRDPDGLYEIVGRSKDVIISGGLNIYPVEVEEVINSLPEVAECAVGGIPSDQWGEEVVAVVVETAGSRLTTEAIVRHCREKLADYKCPKRIAITTGPLPRTTSGKLKKSDELWNAVLRGDDVADRA